jgi:hypothetical protein
VGNLGVSNELTALYRSPYIVRVVKSRRLWWVGNLARIGETRNVYRVLVRNLIENVHLDNQEGDGVGNIKIELCEIGCADGRWVALTQDHVP